MNNWARTICVLAAASVLASSGVVRAVTIAETSLITSNSRPNAVARASNGSIWFTEEAASKIGRIDSATGSITNEFPTDTPSAGPTGLAADLNGFLWFTEQNIDKIGRINAANGVVDEFGVGIAAGSQPNAIAISGSGTPYFTMKGTGKLGLIDPSSGAITEIIGITLSGPAGIVNGPDGKLWITESDSDRISSYDPNTGVLTPFALTAGSRPEGITVGPDNFIWFTEPNRNRVGKINPFNSNVVTEYSAGITATSRPNFITPGSDGNLWYTTQATGRIGRVTPSGNIIEFTSGITHLSTLRGIASDATTSTLWFASDEANKIGKVSALDVIPTTLQFEKLEFQVNELCREAQFKVTRSGDTSTGVSVEFFTSDSTAQAGSDYESKTEVISFVAGQTEQTVIVKILDGDGIEDVEDVNLGLRNPTGGAVLGSPNQSILQIFDATRIDEGRGNNCDEASQGGCTISQASKIDPTLPLLMLGALLYRMRRRGLKL